MTVERNMHMKEILSALIGLLVLAVLFGVVALIGMVGINCRRAYEYGRRGDHRSRKAIFISVIGFLIIVAAGFGVVRMDSRPLVLYIYSVIVLAILIFGWFGRLIVPEGLGD